VVRKVANAWLGVGTAFISPVICEAALNTGRLTMTGPADQMLHDPEVKKAYMGGP